MLYLLIGLAVVYAYLNGYRDSSSIVTGVIASRAIRPRLALNLVAVADFIAPFLFGSAVAHSISTGLVRTSGIPLETIVIAMLAALTWSFFSWWKGIPSSSTHALIGGLLGAVLITQGVQAIQGGGLIRVILPLFIAPVLGLGVGYLIMQALLFLLRNATPQVNSPLRRLQVLTMLLLAMSESANDAQKSMGIITLGLVLAGKLPSFSIPIWVSALCALALSLGASRGDWRQIRNLGGKIYRIRPLNALASQVTSTWIILAASALGLPVSSPHVISTALLGSGAAERINKVRWQVASRMVITWMITIPASMAVAVLLFEASAAIRGLGGSLQVFFPR